MILHKGDVTSVFVPSGQRFALMSTGHAFVTRMSGSVPGETLEITSAYPVTLGPLTTGTSYRLTSTDGELDYSVGILEAVQTRVVRVLSDDLPEFGDTGVIYETELGWKRWDELTGVYLAMDEVPAIPAPVAEGDAPVIEGDTAIGSTLTVVSHGEWSGRPTSFTYQWEQGGEPIEDETGVSYVTVEGDAETDITCQVTGVNAVGASETALDSNAIEVDEIPE